MSLIPLGFWAASGGGFASDFDLLETTTLATSVASVTFSGLAAYAADYKHLQFRVVNRATAATNSQLGLRINGVSSGYSEHLLVGNGSSVGVYGGTGANMVNLGGSYSGQTSGAFDARVIDILDPFSSTKNTTVREFMGQVGTRNAVGLFTGAYFNTAAVSSLSFHVTTDSIAALSRFSIYGVR